MNPTSPEELRALSKTPRHPEWDGRVRSAMLHAALLLEAADLAVKAEVERAETASRELLARQVPETPTPAMVKAMVLAWLSQPAGAPWDDCALAAWRDGVAAAPKAGQTKEGGS